MGEQQISQSFQERVLPDKKKIYDCIAINKSKIFSKPPRGNTVDKLRKTGRMKNRAMVKILSLPAGSKVDLEDLMGYRLTELCFPIFNINGQMRKVIKAKLINCFLVDETKLHDIAYISIIDMGYLWRLTAPTASDREKKVYLGWLCREDLNMIVQRHPQSKEYHLINDRCDVELSLKDAEHQKRNLLFIGGAKNVYPSRNDPAPQLRTFNAFFVNSANKIRLQGYRFEELQNLAVLYQKKIAYSLKEKCLSFKPLTIEQEYFCHQYEADTKMFYHVKSLDSRHDISAVAIYAKDTDLLVISAYASHKLEKDMVLYRRNK